MQQVEKGRSQQNPNDQLSQNRRLSQPYGKITCHFGGKKDDDEQDGELKKRGHMPLFYSSLALAVSRFRPDERNESISCSVFFQFEPIPNCRVDAGAMI